MHYCYEVFELIPLISNIAREIPMYRVGIFPFVPLLTCILLMGRPWETVVVGNMGGWKPDPQWLWQLIDLIISNCEVDPIHMPFTTGGWAAPQHMLSAIFVLAAKGADLTVPFSEDVVP